VNILFCTHCYYPAIDGGSVLFGQLAAAIRGLGHEVEVLTSNRYSTDGFINHKARIISENRGLIDGVPVTRLNVFSRGRKFFRFLEFLMPDQVWTILKKGPVFFNLPEIIKNRKIDWVVGGPFPPFTVFWSWLIAKKSGARLALIPCFHEGLEYNNKFLFRIAEKADLVFCLSNWEKRKFISLGVEKDKVAVINPIVDEFLFKYNRRDLGIFPKEPNVVFLGVKSAHKRIEKLIEAMEILWKKGKFINLTIAGPETLSSHLISTLIKKLPDEYKRRITYLGRISKREKVKLLDKATVLVNPSTEESFGIVFAEAWARKKPVIGSDIPALKEVIRNEKDGLLFKMNDSEDLAKKILFLVDYPTAAKKMGENGYNRVVKTCRKITVAKKMIASLGYARG